jgi:hypothetical protein
MNMSDGMMAAGVTFMACGLAIFIIAYALR